MVQHPPIRALFIGRFQPFHKGHLYVLRQLLKKYPEVIVVIGSAEQLPRMENPFTAGERIEMIRRCFSPAQRSRLIIVPVRDINNHALWVSHLRSYLPRFDTVYSNNDLVQQLFAQAGISVQKFDLLQRSRYQGKLIRERMLQKKRWQQDVPVAVARFVRRINGSARLQKLVIH